MWRAASEAELAAELSVELREVLEPQTALLGCSYFYLRLVTRNTLPLPAGHFRPGIGPALMNIHRLSRLVELAME